LPVFNKVTNLTELPAPLGQVDNSASVPVTISNNQTPIAVTLSAPSGSTTGTVFGRVQYGASAGVLTPIRATVYTEQTANFQGSVKSTSASDSSAGAGARSIRITYYDSSGAGPFTETVVLNGTAAVNLVSTNHAFIEKIEVVTVGSTGWNVGAISLFAGLSGTGVTVGSIAFGTVVSTQGDNRTLWGHHYVPTNKTLSLYNLNCSTTGNQIATVHIRRSEPLVPNSPELIVSDFVTMAANGPLTTRDSSSPIMVSGFSRLTLYAVSQGSNTHFFGSFDYSEI
jgi:hypothetical protein